MQKPTLDSEEWIVSFDDVKRLYISMWKRLVKWSVIGGIAAFVFLASGASKYKAEATFCEGVEASSSGNFIKEFMGGLSSSNNQPKASTIMKSFQVLRPLVENM